MNNPNIHSSPALRMEAWSINCIDREAFANTANRNLLTVAASATAHYMEYLFLMRVIILIHLIRRNAQSITTITDGTGNVITGGSGGGKSHISYKPYGEIHRTDSSGPDVSRFKYTGQEEDKESGLLYYKARYYDPVIGRFIQADSVIMPQSTFGMNRYMYVEGNPVRWSDRSGHKLTTSQAWTLVGYIHGKNQGLSHEDSLGYAAIGAGIGRRQNIREKKERGFVHKLSTSLPIPAWPAWKAFYNGYKSMTRDGLRKGLDNDVKMAAIGYMINGEEGAQWGYLLGTLKNQQTYANRRRRVIDRIDSIDSVLGYLGIGFIEDMEKSTALLLEGGKDSTVYSLTKSDEYTNSALDICTVAAAAHLDKQPNDRVDDRTDQICFYLAGATNR